MLHEAALAQPSIREQYDGAWGGSVTTNISQCRQDLTARMPHLPAAPRKPFNIAKAEVVPTAGCHPKHALLADGSRSPQGGKAGGGWAAGARGSCTTPGTCSSRAQLSVKLALRFSTNAVIPSLRSLWDKQRGQVWGAVAPLLSLMPWG